MFRVGIVTFATDLHAVAVKRAIQRFCPTAIVHTFEVDTLARSPATVRLRGATLRATLRDSELREVDLSELNAVWWRRSSFPQTGLPTDADEDEVTLIQRDSQAFVEGAFVAAVRGAWSNHPHAARVAENKILQLRAAAEVGLAIPDTVVSNNAEAVMPLARSPATHVVKTLAGVPGKSLLTQELTPDLVTDGDRIRTSPACYQRYVEGEFHLRVLVAGGRSAAVRIRSHHVDSRADTRYLMSRAEIDPGLLRQLRALLDRLGLSMAVADLKLGLDEQPCFLEINQQGQFLYLDAICGSQATKAMAMHLLDLAALDADGRSRPPAIASAA